VRILGSILIELHIIGPAVTRPFVVNACTIPRDINALGP
jgi:hypothetical protein